MGWVEPLPSGRFRGVAWNAAAQKRAGSKAHQSWEEADAWWRRREAELDGVYVDAGVSVARQRRDRASFAEYAQGCAARHPGELATRRSFASHCRQLIKHFGGRHVDEVSKRMITDYLLELREGGISASLRATRLSALRVIFTAAVEDGLRSDNPTNGLRTPYRGRRHKRVLSEQELFLVMAFLPAWLWPAALLSHDAGLRISEVAGLRMFRLDLRRAEVQVADVIQPDGSLREYPKGREVLGVPLTPRLVTALTEHLRDYPSTGQLDHVFRGPRTGQRILPSIIREYWRKAVAAAGLDDPQPRWHDLRHGCGTAMARAGAPAYVIQRVLRHAKLATSQQYIDEVETSEQRRWLDLAMGQAAS
jgi:integrase